MKPLYEQSSLYSFWDYAVKEGIATRHYVTLLAEKTAITKDDLEAIFTRLYSYLAERKIHILQEKIYGLLNIQQTALEVRRDVFLSLHTNSILPAATFMEGAPCATALNLSGIQIIGTSHSQGYRVLQSDGATIGALLERDVCHEIFLAGISGGQEPDTQKSLAVKAKTMFQRAQTFLGQRGFATQHIIRTWIYLPRILSWYGEFNRARTQWFKETGLIQPAGATFPASTGIQGTRMPNEECFMDVLAFISKDPKNAATTAMTNPRQNEAREYGSSFARGFEVTVNGQSSFYISGTASINYRGQTVYFGDPQGQITETFLNIGSLLENRGSSLQKIVLATAYCKNRETFEIFSAVVKTFGLTNVPFVPVIADICRDELLFEIDCVAVS